MVSLINFSPLFLIWFHRSILSNATANEHHLAKRALLFPRYTFLQFTYGVSAPAILPSRVINLSLAMQCNFDLPYNLSNFMPITYYARSNEENNVDIDRHTLYQYIINILDGMELSGEDCLLRAICEVAHIPLHIEEEDTLLEKIVHYVLTPSVDYKDDSRIIVSDVLQNATYSFEEKQLEAETIGKLHGNCGRYYSQCAISVLDLISAQYKIF